MRCRRRRNRCESVPEAPRFRRRSGMHHQGVAESVTTKASPRLPRIGTGIRREQASNDAWSALKNESLLVHVDCVNFPLTRTVACPSRQSRFPLDRQNDVHRGPEKGSTPSAIVNSTLSRSGPVAVTRRLAPHRRKWVRPVAGDEHSSGRRARLQRCRRASQVALFHLQ